MKGKGIIKIAAFIAVMLLLFSGVAAAKENTTKEVGLNIFDLTSNYTTPKIPIVWIDSAEWNSKNRTVEIAWHGDNMPQLNGTDQLQYYVETAIPNSNYWVHRWTYYNDNQNNNYRFVHYVGPYKIAIRIKAVIVGTTIAGSSDVAQSGEISASFSEPMTVNPYTINQVKMLGRYEGTASGVNVSGEIVEYVFSELPPGTTMGSTMFWTYNDGFTSMDARASINYKNGIYYARVYWPFLPPQPNQLGNLKIFIAYY